MKLLIVAAGQAGGWFAMAKNWSGFIPQNVSAKEQWAMMEALEFRNRNYDPREIAAAFLEPDQENSEQEPLLHLLDS